VAGALFAAVFVAGAFFAAGGLGGEDFDPACFAGAFFATPFVVGACAAAFFAPAVFIPAFLAGAVALATVCLATVFLATVCLATVCLATVFFAGAFVVDALAAAGAFFAGAFVAAAFFAGGLAGAAAEVRLATTLRAAWAALPASDRVVLRAMVTFQGAAGTSGLTGDMRCRSEGRVYPGERSLKDGTPDGIPRSDGGIPAARRGDTAGVTRERPAPPGCRPSGARRVSGGQLSSSPSTERSRFGAFMPVSVEPGVGSAEPELSSASSCWLK
jgi:hypothetical protein